ncbi:hypothetical protein TNCV_3706011 [Trichonephila clavipes]|nr:hypothetical protein TNCV_3706011 [Trichonephila clavipes]
MKLKTNRIITPFTTEEIEAEEICIKEVQAEKFGIEIKCLKENKNLPKDSKIRELNPFLNGYVEDCISKHSVIMKTSNFDFSELLIKYAHEKVLHSSVADTLIQAREKYWVPNALECSLLDVVADSNKGSDDRSAANLLEVVGAWHVSVHKDEVQVLRLLSGVASKAEMYPGNRDSICVVGFIEVLRKARYLPEWYTTMWKLKESKEMHLDEVRMIEV